MPMIDRTIADSGLTLQDMDAIAVTKGPGSFTGLRIGSATAKGLAEACGIPVIEVPTVDALAMNMTFFDGLIVPLMDARRNETYTGIYTFEAGELKVIREQCAVPLSEIIRDVNERETRTVFLGDGVRVFAQAIEDSCRVPFSYAPASLRLQRASSVAVLACSYYDKGLCVDASLHVPTYLRVSQAERERAAQIRSGVSGTPKDDKL
jgi:tRNA threonylcarbamoyladenosine biosynthesis protein TsaB